MFYTNRSYYLSTIAGIQIFISDAFLFKRYRSIHPLSTCGETLLQVTRKTHTTQLHKRKIMERKEERENPPKHTRARYVITNACQQNAKETRCICRRPILEWSWRIRVWPRPFQDWPNPRLAHDIYIYMSHNQGTTMLDASPAMLNRKGFAKYQKRRPTSAIKTKAKDFSKVIVC
jgi:hypothetical protein